jgi:hypothetical protein
MTINDNQLTNYPKQKSHWVSNCLNLVSQSRQGFYFMKSRPEKPW